MTKHANLLFLLGGSGTCILVVLGILSLPASIPQGNVAIAIYVGAGFAIIMGGYFTVYHAWWNRRKNEDRQVASPTMVPGSPDLVLGKPFDAEFSPKEGLMLGDTVTFTARFIGILVNGYLGTEIRFHNRIVYGCHDYTTISRNINDFTKGKLNGFMNRKFVWTWVIPYDASPGKYEFHIRVHNHIPLSMITTFKVMSLRWLKDHLISSIDRSKLDCPKRPIIGQKIETGVIVSER